MASEAIVARLKAVLSGDSSQLRADLGKAERSLKTFGDNATKVGRSLTTKVTLPMVGLGAAAVKTAADFESSMTKITALVGVAKDEVDTMSVAVRSMATQFGKSANEAADALFYITSAGLRGATATDTLAASLKASAIGLGETSTIADLATSALNAYGADVLSAAQATDVMTATIREGKLETTELAGSMGRVLPLASAMGVNFNEVGAAFAALSRTGTNAAEAATQIRGILASLLRPTKQAEEALTEMGLSSEGLRTQLREEGLLATLKTLSEEFAGNEAAAASVFGNIRALSGVLDLMGANVATTEAIFASMEDTTGAVDEAFAAVSEATAFQFQQAMAEVKELLLSLGQTLLPLVNDGLQLVSASMSGVVNFFSGLPAPLQDISLGLAGVAAIAGPVALGIGAVTKAMIGLKAAAMAHPVLMAFSVALGAIAAAQAIFYREAQEARERQEALTEAFVRAGDPASNVATRLEEIATAMEKVKAVSGETGAAVEEFVGSAVLNTELVARQSLDNFNKLSAEGQQAIRDLVESDYDFDSSTLFRNFQNMNDATGALVATYNTGTGPIEDFAYALFEQVDAGEMSVRELEALLVAVKNVGGAFDDHTRKVEETNAELITSGKIFEDFAGTALEGVVNRILGEYNPALENATELLLELEQATEAALVTQMYDAERALRDTSDAMSSLNGQAVDTIGGLDAFVMALATANDFIGYDITKVQELVHELGILDGLSTETKIAIGLEFEGLDNVRAQLRGVLDVMLKLHDLPMILAERDPKFQAALQALRALDKIASGQEAPGFAAGNTGGGSAASNTIDDIARAAEEAEREAERLRTQMGRLAERVEDMGKVLGDEDFFEFLLGASAGEIEDRFEDIAEAAMELVEQANELGVGGGPEFLQTLAAIGDQFDALAALQGRVASTESEITENRDRLTDATNALSEAQAYLNQLTGMYAGSRTEVQQLSDATNALAEAQGNLNRENERYAAFLYGEGLGGGTFEQVLSTEIDVYRALQRELAGVQSEQAGFRRRVVDMMSPDVGAFAGAGGVMGNIGRLVSQTRQFRDNLLAMRDRGFPTDIIGQVVGAGVTQGNVISKRLLALGTAEFADFLALRDEISRIGVETAAIAGEVIFGADVAEAEGAVRDQLAIVDAMFRSAIAEAEDSVRAQEAVVDAMFTSAIARAEENVRRQAIVVDALRDSLRNLEVRLENLRANVEVLAGDIQSQLTAAFNSFLTGLTAAIAAIPTQVQTVSTPVARPSAPSIAASPAPAPRPTPKPTPAPIAEIVPILEQFPVKLSTPRPTPELAYRAPTLAERYPDKPTARPTPELAYRGRGLPSGVSFRALGGPVTGGRPYLVGEMGPELFVPGASGGILSNRATAQVGAGVVNYNISVTANGDPAEAGRQIVKAIQEYERRNGNRWRSS